MSVLKKALLTFSLIVALCGLSRSTPPTPHLVKDLFTGVTSAGSEARDFTVVGATLYFAAKDATHGSDLWKTDGTAAGTVRVNTTLGNHHNGPAELTAVGTNLFYVAADSTHGSELWMTDGTPAGTR